jgi:hypothetical protein
MEITTMANQDQPDPGAQNQGSADAMRNINRQEELNRKAEREQDEKMKKGGTDSIKTTEDGGIIDGVPGYR